MFNGADLRGKAPSGRELAPQATEGECVAVKRILLHRLRRLLPPLRGPPPSRREAFVSNRVPDKLQFNNTNYLKQSRADFGAAMLLLSVNYS